MISSTLRLIKTELNEFLARQFPADAFTVQANKLVTQDGKSALNKDLHQVVITLLNVQEERTMQRSRTSDPQRPYYLNLLLLFSVHPKESETAEEDYLEGLSYLDAVLLFFQQQSVFTPQSHQNLPLGIHHLQFDLASEDLRETSYIWTITGAKYAPSVLYRVRSIGIGQPSSLSTASFIGST